MIVPFYALILGLWSAVLKKGLLVSIYLSYEGEGWFVGTVAPRQSLHYCSPVATRSQQPEWYIHELYPCHSDSPAINKGQPDAVTNRPCPISVPFLLLTCCPFLFKTLLICGAPVLPLSHDPVSSGGIPSLFLWTPLLVRFWRKARVREVSKREASQANV